MYLPNVSYRDQFTWLFLSFLNPHTRASRIFAFVLQLIVRQADYPARVFVELSATVKQSKMKCALYTNNMYCLSFHILHDSERGLLEPPGAQLNWKNRNYNLIWKKYTPTFVMWKKWITNWCDAYLYFNQLPGTTLTALCILQQAWVSNAHVVSECVWRLDEK